MAASFLPKSKTKPIIIALIVVYFVWGSDYLAVHVALDSFPPLLMSGMRNLLAGMGLFVLALLRRPVFPVIAEMMNAGVVGTMLVGLSSGMITYGMRTVDTGPAAVLVATVLLFAAVIATAAGVSGGVKPLLDGGARLSETVNHEGATGRFMVL
ncbi:EamA family transporter [Burkholderia multivorans]|nr:EamA family transporter [Burkholderia multivorans]